MTNAQAERLFSALFPPDMPHDARILLATYDRTASHGLKHYYARNVPQALETLATFSDTLEVFFCPLLRQGENARKGGVHPDRITWLFADIDYQKVDPDRYTPLYDRIQHVLGSYSVTSGSVDPLGEAPPNEHVYAHLAHPITPDEHERLNYAFGKSLSADSKYTDNTLLRVPGTYNHKTAKPRRSRLTTIDPERALPVGPLTRALQRYGVPAQTGSTAALPPWQAVPVDRVPSRYVRAARTPMDDLEMGRYDGDRSRAVYAVAKDMINAGLTRDEIHTLMADFPPALDKQLSHPKYDHHNDIDRLWLKLAPTPPESSEIAFTPSEPPTPSVSRNAFPPLGRVFEALHHHAGSLPTQMVDMAALITAAALIPRVTFVAEDGEPSPVSLWGLVVAESGAGKTPAQKYVSSQLRQIENDLLDVDQRALDAARAAAETDKGRQTKVKLPKTDTMIHTDVTYAGIIDTLSRSKQNRILLWVDELDTLIKKMGDDYSSLLSAWNNEPIRQTRRKFVEDGGSINVRSPLVNIFGGIQPSRLSQIGTSDKGELPRYLATRVLRHEQKIELIRWSRCPEWDKVVQDLHDHRDRPRTWTLSDAAENLLTKQNFEWRKRQYRTDELSEYLRSFYGKTAEITLRVATVLAEIESDDHSSGGAISDEVMQRALDIMNYSLRIWHELEPSAAPSKSKLLVNQEAEDNLARMYSFVQDREDLCVSASYIRAYGPLKKSHSIVEIKALLKRYATVYPHTVWVGRDTTMKKPRKGILVFREVPTAEVRKAMALEPPTATDLA